MKQVGFQWLMLMLRPTLPTTVWNTRGTSQPRSPGASTAQATSKGQHGSGTARTEGGSPSNGTAGGLSRKFRWVQFHQGVKHWSCGPKWHRPCLVSKARQDKLHGKPKPELRGSKMAAGVAPATHRQRADEWVTDIYIYMYIYIYIYIYLYWSGTTKKNKTTKTTRRPKVTS